jgi:hypothetical protein
MNWRQLLAQNREEGCSDIWQGERYVQQLLGTKLGCSRTLCPQSKCGPFQFPSVWPAKNAVRGHRFAGDGVKEAVHDPLHNHKPFFLMAWKSLQNVGLNVSRKGCVMKMNVLQISVANIKIVFKVKRGNFFIYRSVNLHTRYGIHSLQLHPYNSMFLIGVEVKMSPLDWRASVQPTLCCLEPPLHNNECRYCFHKWPNIA